MRNPPSDRKKQELPPFKEPEDLKCPSNQEKKNRTYQKSIQ